MTSKSLASSYLQKSLARFDILTLLLNKEDYSDVIREAQEIVELCLKGILRSVGIEPPKFHDVGPLFLEFKDRFPAIPLSDAPKIAQISKDLRKERELSFYGDIDFIPTESYSREDALNAIENVKFVLERAQTIIKAD